MQHRDWERCPRCPEPRAGLPEVAWLVPLSGPAAGALWALHRSETLGTEPYCSLVLEDPYASGKHAELRRSAERWLLRDLESSNGTFVNGQRARGAELRDGDELQMGQTRLAFRTLGAPRRPELVAAATANARTGWLVPLAGPDAGQALLVPRPVCRLGGAAPAELRLDDPYVSSLHAEIAWSGGPHLRDLRSSNGTYLNGHRIGREPLLDGDRLRLGGTELVFKTA